MSGERPADTPKKSDGPFAAFGGGLAHDQDGLPEVAHRVDRGRIKQIVTEIKTAEQQIGEHIVRALQEDETVAVITAVVIGADGAQRIVSAGLDADLLGEVQKLLQRAETGRLEESPCVGFHCLLKRKQDDEQT